MSNPQIPEAARSCKDHQARQVPAVQSAKDNRGCRLWLPCAPYFQPSGNPNWQLANTPGTFPWGLPRRTICGQASQAAQGSLWWGEVGVCPEPRKLPFSLVVSVSAVLRRQRQELVGASPARQSLLVQRHLHPPYRSLPLRPGLWQSIRHSLIPPSTPPQVRRSTHSPYEILSKASGL